MRAAEGVCDGVGEQRVRADFDEGAVVLAGGGDGLAEPHRVAQVGRPVVGVEHRCVPGAVDGGDDPGWPGSPEPDPASAARNSGSIGSTIG